MNTKVKWIISASAISTLISVMAGCFPVGGMLGCPNNIYQFKMDARITPDKDTVHIGDTIWVEINSPTIFKDQTSGEEINFNKAANLGTDISFVKLIDRSPIQLEDAVSDFYFDLALGAETPSSWLQSIKLYLFEEINGRYMFSLGIIPKETGTYRINLENPSGVYRKRKLCPKAAFSMRLVQTDQHYYLYPGGDTVTPAGADYYFYVK